MTNIHPITVHFTVALFTVAVLFEILGWLFMKESLREAAWWNLLLALPASIISVLSGLYAAKTAPHNEVIHELVETHELLGFTVVGLILALFIWRTIARGEYSRRLPVLSAIVGIIGLGALTLGAYYGGELVYKHGVGVKPVMETMSATSHDHSSHATNSKKVETDSQDDHDSHQH